MKIQLSDHFTYAKLLRYTLPSVVMMVFTSIYGVVDGFFVSNFVGKPPFTAVNFIYPVVMVLGCVGFMFGSGGGALIAKTLGEGREEEANRVFSLIVYASAACGAALGALGFLFIRPIGAALGARGELLENSVTYARILLTAIPAFVLQFEFQCLFATAGKPAMGLCTTVAAGCANMALDALFVAGLRWGLVGAAAATALSQCVGGIIPLVYFARPNSSLLRLGKTGLEVKTLARACANGSSELMSSVSGSLVGMLFNAQLLRYAGEDGVAAYGVLMYVSLVFQGVFIGYSVGAAPVVGYHYGAQNHQELRGLRRRSTVIIAALSAAMFAAAQALARPLAELYVGYDRNLLELTARALFIFSFAFLFSGFAVFGSSFFTALNNGLVSAVISFLRTLVFQVLAVLIFPLVWGVNGIWLSIVAADALAVAVTALFLWALRGKYRY